MKRITEAYCSFKVAKLLKEKGFDVPIISTWIDHSKLVNCSEAISIFPNKDNWNAIKDGLEDIYFSAPTHQMALKWLREVHKLHIEIFVTWKNKIPHYQWRIENLLTQDTIFDTPCLTSYEEAVEAAIEYCLTNLI